MSSDRFDLTEPPRTTLLKPTGQVRVRLGRFKHTEQPRTTVIKGEAGLQGRSTYREGSSEFGGIDLTEPPRTTVTKGDAGIQGRFL